VSVYLGLFAQTVQRSAALCNQLRGTQTFLRKNNRSSGQGITHLLWNNGVRSLKWTLMSQLIPGRILPPVSFRFTVTGCYDLRASFQQGISSFQVLRQKVCTLLSSSCLFHSSFVLRSSRLSVDLSLCFYKILAHTSLLMSLIVTICYTNHIPTFVSNTTLYNLQYGAGVAQSVYYLTTDWTTGRSGFDFRQRQKIFLYPLCPDRL